LVKEEDKIKNENKLGSSLETPEGLYLKMTDLELFKEAVKVDRGNLTALRKLADLEFQNEMFLEAALSYEKIKDFLSAD